MSDTSISVVIPTLDGGAAFGHLCRHLQQVRERFPLDVLVIDSGSRDGTVAVAEACGLRVHAIDPSEFGHGRTRNLGVQMTDGDVICFLTQDVLPCTPDWPERFAAVLRDPAVAGVYGRQVPRDATSMEMFFVAMNYPSAPLRFSPQPGGHHPRPGRVLFSNAFSAVRRAVVERIPFAHDARFSEDQLWAHEVLAGGYSIIYEPLAEALHAHRYSLRGLFGRSYQVGGALKVRGIDGGATFPESVRFIAAELRYFARQGHWHRLPQLLPYEFVRWAGFQAGRHTASYSPPHGATATVAVEPPGTSRRLTSGGNASAPAWSSRFIAQAGGWAFALRAVDRGIGLLRTVVLARLLAPGDFGLFGIALLAFSALDTLSQTGVHTALIQRQGDIRRTLDTAWTLQAIRGAVLALLLWFSSNPVALFFGEPAAAALVQAMAAVVVLQALTNIGVVHFQKDLRFDRRFGYMASGTAADLMVSVAAAFYLRSAWALVLGLIASSAVRLVASYLVHPYRPRFRWDAGELRELFSFGKWVFASSAMIFLITQGDDVFIGRMLGATALGFYQIAYLISNLPATQVTHLFSEVAFPVFAQVQKDRVRLRRAFFSTLEAIALIALPLAALIGVFADDLVAFIFGTAWMPVVPVVRVLTVLGALRAIGAVNGALYHGSGHPHFDTIAAALHLSLMVVLIYPLNSLWGATGVAVAVTAPMLVSQAYGISRSTRILECSAAEYLGSIAPAVAGAAVAAGCGIALNLLLPAPRVASTAALAILVYVLFACTAVRRKGSHVGRFLTELRSHAI